MNFVEKIKGKKIAVFGLARSGESAGKLLVNLGADVLITDQKTEADLKDIVSKLKSEYPQMKFRLGGHPEEVFDDVDLVVVSPGVPYNIPILEKLREKGISVIGEIELAYRVCRCPIIAITGTKGKSTTSTLAGKILSETYSKGKVVVAGNIGIPLSNYVLDLDENDLLVLEVSSFQLETTVNFRPKVSAILNIMQDHLDRHKDLDEYINAKYRIFANQTNEDWIILNADDSLASECVSRTQAKALLFSSSQILDNGVYLEDGNIVAKLPDKEKIVICKSSELKIPGRHNIENAMVALAVSLIYDSDIDDVTEVLRNFTGIENALEFVGEANGVRFINDTKATNIVSLKAALESINDGIVLIIGGRDKGNDYTQIIQLVKDKVKHLVIIGESADKIEDALGCYSHPHRARTMDDAVRMSFELAGKGDTILLSPACASFDMFRDYAERGKIFKEIAQRIIKSHAK
jgi:UDP-N-acetylmuramoylalanine--D-glutamate ligase